MRENNRECGEDRFRLFAELLWRFAFAADDFAQLPQNRKDEAGRSGPTLMQGLGISVQLANIVRHFGQNMNRALCRIGRHWPIIFIQVNYRLGKEKTREVTS